MRKRETKQTDKQLSIMECQCKPEIKEKLDCVHEEIYGNGDSNKSLVTRMVKVETILKLLLGVSTSNFLMLVGIAVKTIFK